jgi:hypothetical protein
VVSCPVYLWPSAVRMVSLMMVVVDIARGRGRTKRVDDERAIDGSKGECCV